mgnify:CR=1 FL=1
MEASFKQDSKLNKAERYQFFLTQLTPLIEGERNEVSVLANTSAALKEAFGFFWVGFYLVHVEYAARHGRKPVHKLYPM